MTKLAIAVGLVALLLAVGYATPPEVRRATNAKLQAVDTAIATMADRTPSPSAATWQAIGEPWKETEK